MEESYQDKARRIVRDHCNSLGYLKVVQIEEVYVVWFAKTLQNWKALVSTTIEDGRYYEVTYNGDKKETYLDDYVKVSNHAIQD